MPSYLIGSFGQEPGESPTTHGYIRWRAKLQGNLFQPRDLLLDGFHFRRPKPRRECQVRSPSFLSNSLGSGKSMEAVLGGWRIPLKPGCEKLSQKGRTPSKANADHHSIEARIDVEQNAGTFGWISQLCNELWSGCSPSVGALRATSNALPIEVPCAATGLRFALQLPAAAAWLKTLGWRELETDAGGPMLLEERRQPRLRPLSRGRAVEREAREASSAAVTPGQGLELQAVCRGCAHRPLSEESCTH